MSVNDWVRLDLGRVGVAGVVAAMDLLSFDLSIAWFQWCNEWLEMDSIDSKLAHESPLLTTVVGLWWTTDVWRTTGTVATTGEATETVGEARIMLLFGLASTETPSTNTRQAIEMMVFMFAVSWDSSCLAYSMRTELLPARTSELCGLYA